MNQDAGSLIYSEELGLICLEEEQQNGMELESIEDVAIICPSRRELWQILLHSHQDLVFARQAMIKSRIQYLLSTIEAAIIPAESDGNCLVHVAMIHQYLRMYTDEWLQREREQIVEYTINNSTEFPYILDKAKYKRNTEFLLGDHIKAIHHLRKTNIILHQYNEELNMLYAQIWYDAEYDTDIHRVCGILSPNFLQDIMVTYHYQISLMCKDLIQ